MVDELSAGANQAVASSDDRQVGLGLRAPMVDGGEEPRVQPGQPGQVFGVGAIALAGVAEDQAQHAGVGHQDFVTKLGEQRADPA